MRRLTLLAFGLACCFGMSVVVPSSLTADDHKPAESESNETGDEDHAGSKDHADEGAAHTEHGDDAGGHSAGGGGSTNPMTVDPDLAIFTGIVFVLLFLFLAKFAWGPIIEALDDREQGIANQIEEANQNFKKAQEQLAIYDKKLAAAADESRAIIDTARQDAEAVATKIRSDADEDAKRSRDRALADIEAAKNSALRDIAEKSADMAVSLAGNIVRREVKSGDHAELIRSALDKMPSNN